MLSVNDPAPNGKPQLLHSNVTAWAIRYIERGWPVVSLHGILQPGTYGRGKRTITIDKPQCTCDEGAKCKHPGKHPRFKDWQKGCVSLDEINEKWTSFDNIGILTGEESGIFVLDIDPRHGGDESLIELIAEFGPLFRNSGSTLQANTGGGGRHLYFRHPGRPVANVEIRPGIDVRGDRGYVVAPPSVHIGGRDYDWDGITGFDAENDPGSP